MSDDNEWKKLDAPPPPLFLGEKVRNLVKQINDEIIERVVGQQIIYFPIDIEHTNYHPVYGEAIEKTFLPPVRVYARVEYGGVETSFMEGIAIDKKTTAKVMFHKRRLTEDQNLFVREGDFVLYGDLHYQIVSLMEPKRLYGQIEHRLEISAKCVRAREGVFNGE